MEITYLLSGGLVIGSILLWFSRRNRKKYKIGLTYKSSKQNNYIIENCKSLSSQYIPAFPYSNGHIHTVIKSFAKPVELKSRRELVELQDGGTISLDWIEEVPQLPKTAPIIIVIPTLTGDLKTSSQFCKQAFQRGHRCVVFNKRGHGNTLLKTPKLQGFGETAEMRQAVLHIHHEFPEARITLFGSSAGSGLMASYLGEYGSSAIVCAAVGLSPGYDMIDLFANQLPWLYELILLFHLKKILKLNRNMLKTVIDMDTALKSWTFREYDYHVYCKFGGQSSVLEYWKENNPMRNLHNITIPTLCISSLDDPVCIKEVIPYKIASEIDHLLLLTTEKGGHCGFLEGWNLQSTWTDNVILDYFDCVLKYVSDKETN